MFNIEEFIPLDPENQQWDVIVIGAGMGGGVSGYELAKLGKKVLFLEDGVFLPDFFDKQNVDDSVKSRKERGQWPHKIRGKTTFGRLDSFLSLGNGVGGSTNLYAAQLERMHASDFEPKKNYPEICDSHLPDRWPIAYKTFTKYYRKAESLFEVSGTQDPCNLDTESNLLTPNNLTNSGEKLFQDLDDLGVNPYRSHMAVNFNICEEGCPGVVCMHRGKGDTSRLCVEPALSRYGAKILVNCNVTKIHASKDHAQLVECNIDNKTLNITGKVIVLAAGALFTPALLMRSSSDVWPNGLANSSGMVGKNLMFHASDIFTIQPKWRVGKYYSSRQISSNQFYFVGNMKCGNIQEMGFNWFTKKYLGGVISRKLSKLKIKLRSNNFVLNFIASFAEWVFRGSTMFASIIEDIPYLDNRVFIGNNGDLEFEYNYRDELRVRSLALRKSLSKLVKSKYRVIKLNGKNNINFGHSCGTCCFGLDPTQSVLDKNNRSHDISNLFIVDASFFPSSGGANPSLTIAANAIRVAEYIESNWDSF